MKIKVKSWYFDKDKEYAYWITSIDNKFIYYSCFRADEIVMGGGGGYMLLSEFEKLIDNGEMVYSKAQYERLWTEEFNTVG